jgi:RHS repeat-associated protein
MIYENGSLKEILLPEGYWQSGTYYYYLKDHLGDNRVTINSSGTVIEKSHYYPSGMRFAHASTSNSATLPYRYNGKELEAMNGLNQYDYGARRRGAGLPIWTVRDPFAEKYYSWSPYAYCKGNPVNAVDPDGRLVIFINGMNLSSGGKSDYWGRFDNAVMRHLNDYNRLYRDGSHGGVLGLYDNLSSYDRKLYGREQGRDDAAKVFESISDKNGKIKETIKIITHSMGAAYAKGYIESLIDYCKKHNIDPSVIEFEADFAAFQPTDQKVVSGVKTLQFSNYYDDVVNNWWLGSKYGNIKGAENTTDYNENKGHTITDFMDKIKDLPAGQYEVINGQIVPKKQ